MGYLDLAKQAARRKEEDKVVSSNSLREPSNKRYLTESQAKQHPPSLKPKGQNSSAEKPKGNYELDELNELSPEKKERVPYELNELSPRGKERKYELDDLN